ncbi:hypothetical protein [Streptomyces sp. f51]|uniref:hypothetical protein n=1 Tax=Streptomyces sp. f51 TaxID=1827742 RepID=UPI0015CF0463|nr:hypothetical protein [Streptomyces sp. f51]
MQPRPGNPDDVHHEHEPLLTLHAALIFMLGTLTATCAGMLTLHGGASRSTALLTAGAAFAGAVMFFRSLIAASPRPREQQQLHPGDGHTGDQQAEPARQTPPRAAPRNFRSCR